MGIPSTEDPYWPCSFDMPYVHGLIKAYLPRVKEDVSHVIIQCLYHLANFPKLINIGWGVNVSEPKFTSDDAKAAFVHESLQEIGARIYLLIKGGDNPNILPLPSISGKR